MGRWKFRLAFLGLLLCGMQRAESSGTDCEDGWTEYNYRCYRMINEEEAFNMAHYRCLYEFQGNLASANTEAEAAVLEGLVGADTAWIGLERQELSDEVCIEKPSSEQMSCIKSSYRWTDASDLAYTNWYVEPDFEGYVVKLSTLGWKAGDRDEYWNFICERDIDDCSPDPCVNGKCLDAGSNAFACSCWKGFAGTLCDININDCTETSCLHGTCIDQVASFFCVCDEGYGGERCDDKDECLSNPCFNGKCVDLFEDFDCICDLGFKGRYCEEPRADMCDHGWAEYNWKCYKYFEEDKAWYDGNTHCQDFKGKLVSADSSGENAFIKALLPQDGSAWIGVKNKAEIPCDDQACYQDNCFWTDGTEYSFRDWAATEPARGQCGRVTADGWFGGDCFSSSTFMCEKEQDQIFACNFGNVSICTLIQDQTDEADWALLYFATASPSTGPASGYGGSGYYIYFETSAPRVAGEKARIYTKPLNYTGEICVRFAYNMYGEDVNSLRLYRFTDGDTTLTNVYEVTGNQGQGWFQAAVDMTATTDMRLGWEATRGPGWMGDIAIDRIRVFKYACSQSEDPGEPKDLVICNFESGTICNLNQATSDDFDWSVSFGQTDTLNTGPEAGFGYSGYYAYIRSNENIGGKVARVYSNILGYEGEICVRFTYNMYGEEIGRLSFYYFTSDDTSRTTQWELMGNHGPGWYLATVELVATADMRLGWEGRTGQGPLGDLAIDEIRVFTLGCAYSERLYLGGVSSMQVDDDGDDSSSDGNSGTIIGACVGAMVGLGMLVGVAAMVYNRKRPRGNASPQQAQNDGYEGGTRT